MAYYGQNSGSRKDIHYTDVIREACQLVDDSVNFADYDADGDGKVDLLYIIYADTPRALSKTPQTAFGRSREP